MDPDTVAQDEFAQDASVLSNESNVLQRNSLENQMSSDSRGLQSDGEDPLTMIQNDAHHRKSHASNGMVIGLTIAILLPPALLVGAIIGYLVAIN